MSYLLNEDQVKEIIKYSYLSGFNCNNSECLGKNLDLIFSDFSKNFISDQEQKNCQSEIFCGLLKCDFIPDVFGEVKDYFGSSKDTFSSLFDESINVTNDDLQYSTVNSYDVVCTSSENFNENNVVISSPIVFDDYNCKEFTISSPDICIGNKRISFNN